MGAFTTTFCARMFGALAVIATSAVVGRVLGPEARGAIETLLVLRLALHAVAGAGAPAAATWLVAREPASLVPVVRTTLALALVTGAAAGVLVVAAGLASPAWFAPLPTAAVAAFAVAAPATVAAQGVGGALLGAGRTVAWNLVAVGSRATLLVALAVLAVPALRTPSTVVAGLVAAEVVALAIGLRAARTPPAPALDRALVGRAARYAGSAWLHATVGFALLRADVLLLDALAGTAETGRFAAASLARDMLLFVPWVAGMLFFPRVAAADASGRARPAGRVVGPVPVACTVVTAAALLAWPEGFVTGLHGARFSGAGDLVRWLVPAALVTGVAHVGLQELLGRGAPRAAWLAPLLALAVGVAGDLVLVPREGALGAAKAALAAALTLLAVTAAGVRRARRDVGVR
ncbi:MAG: hypothetical protein IT460_11090 [Planctomycetes bacterium]|nr:hypothetical protein [Planctomycetota bacterium]